MNDLATNLTTQGGNSLRTNSNQLLSGLTPFTLKSEHQKKKEEGKSHA